jgi:anti-anti-sigma factor
MTESENKANTKVIEPGKNLIASQADDFRKKLLKTIEEDIQELIIDFAKVEEVDSVGMALIIAAHNSLKNSGRVLRLKNVSEENYKLFNITRLDQQFEVKT